MPAVCEGLVAKLDELMDFLRFAKLPSGHFRGVVRTVLPYGLWFARLTCVLCRVVGDVPVPKLC